jgi:hypothetical protein
VPIAMRAFYERWLWIMKLFSVQESRLSPRAAKPEDEKPTNIAEIKTLKRDDVTPSLLANASPQWTSLSPQKRAAQRL